MKPKEFLLGFMSLILVLLFFIESSTCESLNLTKQQSQKLVKLKASLSNVKLPKEWMKDDLNLVRYLRARVWDEKRAKDMLMETVKWWKDYGMDGIHKEDFSMYEKEYPIYLDGVDKNGQPMFAFSFGEWDLRAAVVKGNLKGVIRWLFKRRDEVHEKTRNLVNSGSKSINGSQWNFILNLDKFNQNQHLCAQCLQLYTDWTATFETHYPGCADKIILVNTPSVFDIVLTLVRPLFSQTTRTALKTYGNNKAEWSPLLFAGINKDQLPENFGGTRKYTHE